MSPLKAIHAFCIDCQGSARQATNCDKENCPLWAFRTGKNSLRAKRVLTDEQRQAAADRLKKAREGKKKESV
jgi:hypothetical protein